MYKNKIGAGKHQKRKWYLMDVQLRTVPDVTKISISNLKPTVLKDFDCNKDGDDATDWNFCLASLHVQQAT